MIKLNKFLPICLISSKTFIFAELKCNGTLAQLVEQRTENPCVRSSILRGTTKTPFKEFLYLNKINQIKMKKITLIICLAFISFNAIGQTDESSYEEFLQESPFNRMYPKLIASEAAQYFGDWNKLFSSGPTTTKEARLAAISASAAIKCEYCIKAQVIFAKKAGLTDDEIKAAVQIAAEVARFSTLLYGNEFTDEEFNKALEKILSGL